MSSTHLRFFLMRHKYILTFFVHPEETRCATKRAVFQSGNFILGQERGHSPTFFSCFEDVNFPGPTSIKISCVCSSELLHWFDPAFFLRNVIVYHASRLPALNILDKLIKVDTIGRCPIQSLNGTEVFFSVYSHYDSSSQHMSPRSKKISKKL